MAANQEVGFEKSGRGGEAVPHQPVGQDQLGAQTGCGDHDVKRALVDLEKASDEVREAVGALQLAEKNLEYAEAELKEAQEHPQKFKVTVLYNGLEREIPAEADELVKALLAAAIAAFGSLPNPHMLSLFTVAGVELDDSKTLRAAGVKPCEKLLLRPSAVKGGA